MLTLWDAKHAGRGAGCTRRNFLRVGALGLGGLTLADLLRHEAHGGKAGRPKSVIYVVLSGGPSHIDMYDLKPEAPLDYRGPFRPIATRVPGVQICEHLPLEAQIFDQLALLRGVRSVESDHFLSEVYTGLPRTAGARPAFGSVASRLAKTGAALPAYVSLGKQAAGGFDFERAYYVGAAHGPFRPFGDALDDMNPVKDLDHLHDRKRLLAAFDSLRRKADKQLDGGASAGLDRFQSQALEIIASPKVRDAFDLSQEPEHLLSEYGHKAGKYPHQTVKNIFYDWDARPFLLARRLVEAGVRVVTLRDGEWDHHGGPRSDIFAALKMKMALLDRSLCALVNDLKVRGLDQDVLVAVLGEFGRSPKIEAGPGRNHWPEAGCMLFAGGGLRMGQVIGETDSRAERAKSGRIGFQNVMATVYHVLGIDPKVALPDFRGRPQYLLDDGEPIAELL
ncbi:MAG TPA: DUF1501 domain-containing protein [Pirellulales bacterium]|nr:DUF1501 domain-containing protein [Pirellulales bacterium]